MAASDVGTMQVSPTPLPENPFPEGAFRVAYDRCLSLEAAAPHLAHAQDAPPPVVCARLLGHLLRLAPAGNGQGQLQREIASAEGDSRLMELAGMYCVHFIRPFKHGGGRTPAPSEHPSRPSFEDAREYADLLMEKGKLDHRSARDLALRRDGDKCMLTGYRGVHARGVVPVEAAHIIPASTTTHIERGSEKRYYMTGVWAILAMFSRNTIIEELAGDCIHRLENIVTMNVMSHWLFDDLKLWLKPVDDTPHMYRVCVAYEDLRTVPSLPDYVTFSTATDLPLPDPEFLRLHALCCEVALMSGAAEYVENVERRMDDTTVLANDGSSVGLLMTALSLVEAW